MAVSVLVVALVRDIDTSRCRVDRDTFGIGHNGNTRQHRIFHAIKHVYLLPRRTRDIDTPVHLVHTKRLQWRLRDGNGGDGTHRRFVNNSEHTGRDIGDV